MMVYIPSSISSFSNNLNFQNCNIKNKPFVTQSKHIWCFWFSAELYSSVIIVYIRGINASLYFFSKYELRIFPSSPGVALKIIDFLTLRTWSHKTFYRVQIYILLYCTESKPRYMWITTFTVAVINNYYCTGTIFVFILSMIVGRSIMDNKCRYSTVEDQQYYMEFVPWPLKIW